MYAKITMYIGWPSRCFSDVNQIIFKYASSRSHMAPSRVNFVDETTFSETVIEFSLIYFTKFHIQKKNSRFCVHINYNHHIFSIKNFKIFIHMISLSVCVWYRIPKTVSLKVMLIWKYTWTKNKLSKIRWDVIYQWPKITLRGHETSLVVLRSSILTLLLSVT